MTSSDTPSSTFISDLIGCPTHHSSQQNHLTSTVFNWLFLFLEEESGSSPFRRFVADRTPSAAAILIVREGRDAVTAREVAIAREYLAMEDEAASFDKAKLRAQNIIGSVKSSATTATYAFGVLDLMLAEVMRQWSAAPQVDREAKATPPREAKTDRTRTNPAESFVDLGFRNETYSKYCKGRRDNVGKAFVGELLPRTHSAFFDGHFDAYLAKLFEAVRSIVNLSVENWPLQLLCEINWLIAKCKILSETVQDVSTPVMKNELKERLEKSRAHYFSMLNKQALGECGFCGWHFTTRPNYIVVDKDEFETCSHCHPNASNEKMLKS